MPTRDHIEERALSIAKTYDHSVLQPAHLLLALLELGVVSDVDSATNADLVERTKGAIKTLRVSPMGAQTISLAEDTKLYLDKCKYQSGAQECEKELAQTLIGVELIQASTASSTKNSSQDSSRTEPLSLQEALDELDSLVGLDAVKADVKKLIAVHQANKVRTEAGLNPVPQSLHLVFSGSPGTGKTTVARSIARIYCAIGLLPKNVFVEVGRADLVAGYVGQTALKVQSVIQSAMGGVLFIDEAYGLSNDSGAGYGDEAITELVKAMEEHRHELAVIAAGYREDMKLFVASNSGLKSRFHNFINFPDYSSSELVEIFQNLASGSQIQIAPDLQRELSNYLSSNVPKGEMGNARFVRNLFERMFKNMSTRAAEDGVIEIDEIAELQIADLPPMEHFGGTQIGFGN